MLPSRIGPAHVTTAKIQTHDVFEILVFVNTITDGAMTKNRRASLPHKLHHTIVAGLVKTSPCEIVDFGFVILGHALVFQQDLHARLFHKLVHTVQLMLQSFDAIVDVAVPDAHTRFFHKLADHVVDALFTVSF